MTTSDCQFSSKESVWTLDFEIHVTIKEIYCCECDMKSFKLLLQETFLFCCQDT